MFRSIGFAAALLFIASAAQVSRAESTVDPASLYEVSFGASERVTKGEKGRVTVRIQPKSGAHVSAEAPASLTLVSGPGLSIAREKSGKADLKFAGDNASFEVPFTASASGKSTIDASLRFYICTEQACTQQDRKASLTVAVP